MSRTSNKTNSRYGAAAAWSARDFKEANQVDNAAQSNRITTVPFGH
ncbi:hypothetical protein ACH6EH_18080 [Paenibacillus sp. JSM ZJ436]